VLLDGSGQMVDCIGFDPTLRELDVADDLAFLVMDLVARGGEQLAQTLVHAYRDAGGNPGRDALIAFFAANRALVRAKVALLRAAAQAPPSSAARGRQNAAARDLVALAERFAWRARLPLAIVVCGVPAADKSTLEWALAATSGLPHLNSDATRKQLAGIESHQRAPAALYSAEVSRRTHAELGQRARGAIAIHGGVLIDATFRHRADRDAFAAAFSDAAPVLFVECRAPARVLAERAVQRDQSPARVSDASVAVVVRERSSFDPLDEVEPEAHLTVRTDRPSEAVVAELVPCSMGASVGSRGSAHAKRPARDAAYGSRPRRGATMTRRATTRADEALIIVDLQQDFCPGGALAVGGADQIVGEINRLAAASPFVIATRDWHPPNHGSFASEGGPWPVHCVRDSPARSSSGGSTAIWWT